MNLVNIVFGIVRGGLSRAEKNSDTSREFKSPKSFDLASASWPVRSEQTLAWLQVAQTGGSVAQLKVYLGHRMRTDSLKA